MLCVPRTATLDRSTTVYLFAFLLSHSNARTVATRRQKNDPHTFENVDGPSGVRCPDLCGFQFSALYSQLNHLGLKGQHGSSRRSRSLRLVELWAHLARAFVTSCRRRPILSVCLTLEVVPFQLHKAS
jgi:hypothetical protein